MQADPRAERGSLDSLRCSASFFGRFERLGNQVPVLGDLDQVDALLDLDLGLKGVPTDPGGPGDVADRAALGVFAQAFLYRLGALVELDFLVVDDQDLFDERSVFGDDDW